MNPGYNVLLVGRDKGELVALERVLNDHTEFRVSVNLVSNGHFDPLHGISYTPDLLVLCLSAAWQDELQHLADRPPVSRPPVIVVANPGHDMELVRRAMHAGARDILTRPADEASLLDALNKVAEEKSAASGSGPLLTAFVNAKGGSGATLLAANVAHVMAKKLRQATALVDMDIQFGTLGLNLDIQPKMGIVEVLEYTDHLDAVALKAYMVNHESGVHVLATTLNNVALPREIDIGRLNRLLTTLQSTFDHTVVDLPRQIDLPTTTVLERADHIVITTQQGLSHLRDTRRLYGILNDEVGIDRDRLLVAVNRYDAKAAITLDDIRKMLQDIPVELIPNDYKRVSENINLGIPLYSQSRSAPISKAIVQLAGRLSNQDMTVRKKSLLSRMIGRSIPGRRLSA